MLCAPRLNNDIAVMCPTRTDYLEKIRAAAADMVAKRNLYRGSRRGACVRKRALEILGAAGGLRCPC